MLKRFFELASLVLQYLIPFAAISYSYTKIWRILSKHTKPGRFNPMCDYLTITCTDRYSKKVFKIFKKFFI